MKLKVKNIEKDYKDFKLKNISFIYCKTCCCILYFTFDSFLIPFSTAKNMIADIILNGSLEEGKMLINFISLFANSIIYFMIGVVIYKYIEKLTLKKSSIGN